MKQKISEHLNSRFGFFLFAVVLFWLKTYLAYHTAFSLGVDGWFQQLILLINPIATTLLILGLSLFVKDPKKGYTALIVLYIFNSILSIRERHLLPRVHRFLDHQNDFRFC